MELARRLGLSVPGVGYAVERGEPIARENNYQLLANSIPHVKHQEQPADFSMQRATMP